MGALAVAMYRVQVCVQCSQELMYDSKLWPLPTWKPCPCCQVVVVVRLGQPQIGHTPEGSFEAGPRHHMVSRNKPYRPTLTERNPEEVSQGLKQGCRGCRVPSTPSNQL